MKREIRLLLIFALTIFVFIVSFCALFKWKTVNTFADSVDIYSCSSAYVNNEDIIKHDSVIVTLTEEASKGYKNYSANDFKEVGCVEVEDLTKFTADYTKNKSRGRHAGKSMLVKTENYTQILKLSLIESDVTKIDNVIDALNERDDVEIAAPNYIYTVASTPNDIYFGQNELWGLNGTRGIQAEATWGISTGSSTVTVGVLDTGIQADHLDLTNRISTAGLHRDCTVSPITSVSKNDLVDPNGHGTHVAGIIGAQGNNSIGISGVCWDIRLVSLRVFDKYGSGNTESIVRAIDFAASQNISILNFSGGGSDNDNSLQKALKNYNGLFVCAAGNGGADGIGDNNDIINFYPSNYSYDKDYSDRIVSVGAISENGKLPFYSNYGEKTVSIFAPGDNILSTFPQGRCNGEKRQTRYGEYLECECEWTNQDTGEWEWLPNGSTHYADGYHIMDGTSMATPFVTGVAALMLSENPNLTGSELKTLILASAYNHVVNISGKLNTIKLLDGYEALRLVDDSDSKHLVFLETTNNPEGTQADTQFLWLKNGEPWPATVAIPEAPFGYEFKGYYYGGDYAADTQCAVYLENGNFNSRNYYFNQNNFNSSGDITLQGRWIPKSYYFILGNRHAADWDHPLNGMVGSRNYEEQISKLAVDKDTVNGVTKAFTHWEMSIGNDEPIIYSKELQLDFKVKDIVDKYCRDYDDRGQPTIYFYAIYNTDVSSGGGGSCIAPGSLITLADGTQKAVELLDGSENLLVWDMHTGSFTYAPILFIDSEPLDLRDVINLYFSDGTTVEVIYEHAFWDCNLNEYVFLRNDADKYIGHWFNKQTVGADGEMSWTSVQLIDVVTTQEYTAAWSPVTYGYLCYYVNGMLSMPGATEGLINIFDVEADSLKYNEADMSADIDKYGLYTYEEFAEIYPISENIFNAFNGQYLKVSIGKGLITAERIENLINRYSEFFD